MNVGQSSPGGNVESKTENPFIRKTNSVRLKISTYLGTLHIVYLYDHDRSPEIYLFEIKYLESMNLDGVS